MNASAWILSTTNARNPSLSRSCDSDALAESGTPKRCTTSVAASSPGVTRSLRSCRSGIQSTSRWTSAFRVLSSRVRERPLQRAFSRSASSGGGGGMGAAALSLMATLFYQPDPDEQSREAGVAPKAIQNRLVFQEDDAPVSFFDRPLEKGQGAIG